MHTPDQLAKIRKAEKELRQLQIYDTKQGGAISKLCLPERYKLPQFRELFDSNYGDMLPIIDETLKPENDINGKGLRQLITQNSQLASMHEYLYGKDYESIHIFGIVRRHFNENGRIFTLTDQLTDRLLDSAKPSEKILASHLRLPYQSLFLEFGPPTNRTHSKITIDCDGAIGLNVEGVYITEIECDSLYNSQGMIEHFGLTKKDKYRLIELGICISPLRTVPPSARNAPFNIISMQYIMICIPDEKMPLNECIELNKSYYRSNMFDTVFNLVYNSLLYINLDSRITNENKVSKNNLLRIKNVKNPAKKRKATYDAAKDYPHIQIGSTRPYIAINSFSEHYGSQHKGKVKPHPRRGYFGLRNTKSGSDKIAKITWIKSCIINKDMLTNDEISLIEHQYMVI